MSLIGKLLLGLAVTSANVYALGIVMVDPTFGLPGDPVFGDPLKYALQDASFVGPSTGPGPFTLIVDTNYPVALPGSPDVIPSFNDFGATLRMSDYLIHQGNNFWGVVLSAHDGYVAGDVYRASGFVNNTVGNSVKNPVAIAGNGIKIGTGTVSAAPNPGCIGFDDGVHHSLDCALYKVTETFTIDPGFAFIDATAPWSVIMSSATCANAVVEAEVSPETPEAATSWLMGLGIAGLLTCRFHARRRSSARNV